MAITSPRLSQRGYPAAKVDHYNEEEHRRELAGAINNILEGKLNVGQEVTLRESQTTTILTDYRIHPNAYIDFMPLTANAAAEKASGSMYVSSRGKQTATITHQSLAQSDLTFRYLVIG